MIEYREFRPLFIIDVHDSRYPCGVMNVRCSKEHNRAKTHRAGTQASVIIILSIPQTLDRVY